MSSILDYTWENITKYPHTRDEKKKHLSKFYEVFLHFISIHWSFTKHFQLYPSYFRAFALLGITFTKYHICLFTLIISLTYGFLLYPVFLIACTDYYLNFSKPTKLVFTCQNYSILLLHSNFNLDFSPCLCLGDPAIYQNWVFILVNALYLLVFGVTGCHLPWWLFYLWLL